MDSFITFFKKDNVQTAVILFILCVIAYLLHDFMGIILLTTIFAYIAISIGDFAKAKFKIPYTAGVIFFYVFTIGFIITTFSLVGPLLFDQIRNAVILASDAVINHPAWNKQFDIIIDQAIKQINLAGNVNKILTVSLQEVQNYSTRALHIVLALFLSFVFAITRRRLTMFASQFKEASLNNFFIRAYELVRKFITILGRVVETQIIIGFINTILTTLGLYLIGMPNLLVLSLIIAILSLIPVAGVLISMIPLILIAFASGGLIRVALVIGLIIIIHLFEAYVLHPRLMANSVNLPVFVAFLTLIVSEHFLGPWGLIIGIPILSFALDILGVQDMDGHHNIKKQTK